MASTKIMRPCLLLLIIFSSGTHAQDQIFSNGFETRDGPPIAKIEVHSAAVLFTEINDSRPLQAQAYDADDQLIPDIQFQWDSNDDATVSVDQNGVITAQAGLGSAQITATAEGFVSPPVTALVAIPVAGAVLIDDAEVLVPPTLVDPNADLELGLQFFTTLDGAKALQVGDRIIGTGAQPIGGVVIAVEAQGDGSIIVTYETVPLDELFESLLLEETYDLSYIPPFLSEEGAALYDLEDLGDGVARLTLKPELNQSTAMAIAQGSTAQATIEFMLGIFKCQASAPPPFTLTTNPGTITVTTSAALSVQFAVPITGIPDVELARLNGEIRADFSAGIELTAQLSGEVACEAPDLINRTIVFVGPTFIFSPTMSMGPTVKLGGTVDVDDLGFELTASAGANGFVEFRCPASVLSPCRGNAGFSAPAPEADYDIDIPDPNALANLKIQPELSAGVTGAVSFGLPPRFRLLNALLGTLTIEAAKASLGLKQTGDLAFVTTQVEDEEYASSYKLAYEWEAGPGEQVEKLLSLLSSLFNLGPDLLKISGGDDLATSPAATVATADVDSFDNGDSVNFTVNLNPSTTNYPFFGYNVDRIKIYRRTSPGNVDEIADVAATSGQTSFEIPWTADADGSISGEAYYPFVTTHALPVPHIGELELARVSAQCPPGDISGNWVGMWSGQHPLGGQQVNDGFDVNFEQMGTSVGGTWDHGFSSATSDSSPIVSGNYSADSGSITFSVLIQPDEGSPVTVNFMGIAQCGGPNNDQPSMIGTHDSGDGHWNADFVN